MPTKICAGCEQEKPITEFGRRLERINHPHQPYCRACHAARQTAHYAKNREAVLAAKRAAYSANIVNISARRRAKHSQLSPEKKRAKTLMERYGLTVEQYDEMLRLQGGVCAICQNSETRVDYRTGEVHALPVDHDKITGRIRGLLCTLCNTAIGMLDHDLDRLRAAIRYLESDAAAEAEAAKQ